MLVKHLIRELSKFDPELMVTTEGCDCNGDTYAVSTSTWRKGQACVYIRRSDNTPEGVRYNNSEDTPVPYND